jgi:PDZ domain
MEPNSLYRPRVSRETRLLITAALLAVAALWLLARIRFRDRPSAPSPIPAVLSQLGGGLKLDDLATEIADLHTRLEASLIAVDRPAAGSPLAPPERVAALRYRDDLALTLLEGKASTEGTEVVARDPASGVALVRSRGQAPGPPLATWTPRRLERPRYLVATDISSVGVSLRPAFIASLEAVSSPLWPEGLWRVPGGSDIVSGSFLFTADAELVGLVIPYGSSRAIVPGPALLAEAQRLTAQPTAAAGILAIDVQPLTAPVAAVTGAAGGVVVTWVAPGGPAAGQLMVGDVVEGLDSRALTGPEEWNIRMARLSAGQTVALRVRSRGQVREIVLVAATPSPSPVGRSLGLVLRARPKLGAEVIRVQPGSAAEQAGLTAADVITLIGDVDAPTPAQVARSFGALKGDQQVLIGVTRADAHLVTVLQP